MRPARLLSLSLVASIALRPSSARAQEALGTSRTFDYQYQFIGEYERRWNERRVDSRLNPNNIAQLRAGAEEARFYPTGDFTFGRVKVRGDVKVAWQPYGATSRDSARTIGEVQELRAGIPVGDAGYVMLGRQRLGWGTGLVWNPTRIEPQRDPLRPQNRLRGADAARFEYIFSSAITANVLYLPAQLGQPSAFAGRFESRIRTVGFSASVVSPGTGRWRAGWDATTAFDHGTVYAEGAVRARSLRPWLDSIGVPHPRPEAQDLTGLYHDIVIGSLLTPTARTQFVVEYRYQSDYATARDDDVFLRFLPRNSSLYDPLGRGRNRLYMNGRYGLPGGSGPSLGAFFDPATHQWIVMPGVSLASAHLKLDLTGFAYRDRAPVSVFRRQVQCVMSAYY